MGSGGITLTLASICGGASGAAFGGSGPLSSARGSISKGGAEGLFFSGASCGGIFAFGAALPGLALAARDAIPLRDALLAPRSFLAAAAGFGASNCMDVGAGSRSAAAPSSFSC